MDSKEAKAKELRELGREAALGKEKIRKELGLSNGKPRGFYDPPELIAYEKEIEKKYRAIVEKYKDK